MGDILKGGGTYYIAKYSVWMQAGGGGGTSIATYCILMQDGKDTNLFMFIMIIIANA